jgi:hypothetical protein
MAAQDLTTLVNYKAFAGVTTSNDDTTLARLITAMSNAFLQETNRQGIVRKKYTEILDGGSERVKVRSVPSPWFGGAYMGGSYGEYGARGFAINLLQSPVIGDPTLTIDGSPVPKRTDLAGSGWVLLDAYRLELIDYEFTRGVGNVQIDYEAGEYTQDERGTVPSTPGYTIQAQQNDGTFLSDVGVKYASTGTALTQVSGAPIAGQYSVNATGLYTFAAADAGAAVLLSYTVRPADVEQCVIEMVQFVRRSGERSGQRSKTVGNETISFITNDWPATVQCVIDRWRIPPV